LKPLIPRVDQTLHAIVTDLEHRGMLDSTLILMMGEFGRSPVINAQAGRDHWARVMSMVMAGGGMNHGQVIGSTVFHHLGIDLNSHWINRQGRPVPIVTQGGKVISELV
jgi:uncharacterized protein (DUF1501 family)